VRALQPVDPFGVGRSARGPCYTHLPLLEEVGYVPKEKYSYGDEILAHSQAPVRGRHNHLGLGKPGERSELRRVQ
jgi:hypothetical protein